MKHLGVRHQKVARLRKLLRRRDLRESEGVFVAEGTNLLAEAVRATWEIESVFVDGGFVSDELAELQEAGVRVNRVQHDAFVRVASTVTPQPVMSIVRTPDVSMDRLHDAHRVVVLDNVRDPGNAGTILRVAEAAGFDAVVFSEQCVDPFAPKTVRSSAGAVFHVPILLGPRTDAILAALKSHGFNTYATTRSGTAYTSVEYATRLAVLLGNEAHGLSDDIVRACDGALAIPHHGRAESLNVSMAAAVLCFDIARRRAT